MKVSEDGKKLEGAEFTLYRDGEEFKTEASDRNGVVRFTDLVPGNYAVIETKAPDGFIANTNTGDLDFVIPESFVGELPVKELGSLINYQGEVSFVKLDNLGDPLLGAEFTLYDKDGNPVKDQVEDSMEEGKVTFKNLAPGDYTIKETKAPDGYILNEKEIPFTIEKETNEKPATQDLADFVNFKGSVAFVKTDEAGKGLQGAEFTLYNEAGEKTVTLSAADGEVRFEGLAPGKYKVKETKAAPGYLLNTAEMSVEIVASYLPTDDAPTVPTEILADFINYQGTATLTKVDAKDKGKVLAGAEFKLVDSKEKTVRKKLVSDQKGLVSVKDLAPGTYFFVETKAPKGYELSEEKVEVVIADAAENKPATKEVSMTNKLLPVKPTDSGKPGKNKLPQTGSRTNTFLMLVGLLMTSFVVYFLQTRRHIPKHKEYDKNKVKRFLLTLFF